MSLTKKQEECLDAIKGYIAAHGIPPTQKEIMKILGKKSPQSITFLYNKLEEAGYIRRTEQPKARALWVLK